MSKYHNSITTVDNIRFDSQMEAYRYSELKLLLRGKIISHLILQPKFVLMDKFVKNGKTYQPIRYVADFQYYDNEKKRTVIEDVKGMQTEVFKIKHKLFEYQYPELTLTLI